MTSKLAVAMRWGIAAVFIYAGLLKAFDPAGFAIAVGHYRLLPPLGAAAVALYLPWLEIACGFGVLGRRFRMGALVVLTGLTVMFALAIGSAILRGLDIECGCFSSGSSTTKSAGTLLWALGRSMLLASTSAWLCWRERVRTPGQSEREC